MRSIHHPFPLGLSLVAALCGVGSAAAPTGTTPPVETRWPALFPAPELEGDALPSGLESVSAVASIWVDPNSADRALLLVVEGLDPSKDVVIGAGPVDSEYEPITTATADAAGRLQVLLPTFGSFVEQVLVVADQRQNVLAISNPVSSERLAPGDGDALPTAPEWI